MAFGYRCTDLHIIRFLTLHMSTFGSRIVGADGIPWWSPSQLLATKKIDFIVKCNCVFSRELLLFSLKFLSFAYYLCLFNMSTPRPTLFLYVELVRLKSFFNNSSGLNRFNM